MPLHVLRLDGEKSTTMRLNVPVKQKLEVKLLTAGKAHKVITLICYVIERGNL